MTTPLYIMLSHPAYDNQKFRAYADIPAHLRKPQYAAEILTTARTFEPRFTTPVENWFTGSAAELQGMVAGWINEGKNPLIVKFEFAQWYNPEPLTEIKLPRKLHLTVYHEILKLTMYRKTYDTLFQKMSAYLTDLKDKLELDKDELRQLLEILRIELNYEPEILKPKPTPSSRGLYDPPPKNVPLFDMAAFDENGEPIELAKPEPEPEPEPPISVTAVSPKIYFGVSKADRLAASKAHDRLTHRKHKRTKF